MIWRPLAGRRPDLDSLCSPPLIVGSSLPCGSSRSSDSAVSLGTPAVARTLTGYSIPRWLWPAARDSDPGWRLELRCVQASHLHASLSWLSGCLLIGREEARSALKGHREESAAVAARLSPSPAPRLSSFPDSRAAHRQSFTASAHHLRQQCPRSLTKTWPRPDAVPRLAAFAPRSDLAPPWASLQHSPSGSLWVIVAAHTLTCAVRGTGAP